MNVPSFCSALFAGRGSSYSPEFPLACLGVPKRFAAKKIAPSIFERLFKLNTPKAEPPTMSEEAARAFQHAKGAVAAAFKAGSLVFRGYFNRLPAAAEVSLFLKEKTAEAQAALDRLSGYITDNPEMSAQIGLLALSLAAVTYIVINDRNEQNMQSYETLHSAEVLGDASELVADESEDEPYFIELSEDQLDSEAVKFDSIAVLQESPVFVEEPVVQQVAVTQPEAEPVVMQVAEKEESPESRVQKAVASNAVEKMSDVQTPKVVAPIIPKHIAESLMKAANGAKKRVVLKKRADKLTRRVLRAIAH